MNIQIASDLHLDMYKNIREIKFKNILKPCAPYLALLGDIAQVNSKIYFEFLDWVSKQFQYTFIVLGNHEFYEQDVCETIEKVKLFCSKYNNLYFLNNNEYVVTINNTYYHILGSTLWSYIPYSAQNICQFAINDYNYIIYNKRHLTTTDTNNFHKEAVDWLKTSIDNIINEIKEDKNENEYNEHKIIVFTHHAPLLKGVSDPKYELGGRELNYAFCSNLEYLIKNPIVLWGFGHTHYCSNFIKNNVRVTSNCRGYVNETDKYKIDYVINL